MVKKFQPTNWNAVIISTLISVSGLFVNYYYFHNTYKQVQESKIGDKLDILYSIQISYPYVEDSVFIARYCNQKLPNNDSSMRYTIYCEKVFNFIQELAEYNDYDKKPMDEYVNVFYFINTHKCWLKNEEKDPLITKDYPKKFIDLANSYIDK